MAKWSIELDNLPQGGFATHYFREVYPRFGDRNQAGAMVSMDLTRSGYIQPGPAITVYPGSVSQVTTTIRGIVENYYQSNYSYAVGGDKFYTITPTSATVTHTISASTAAITGHDIESYNNYYYYSWLDANGSGNIGKYNGNSTWDDDWWTATISATALHGVSGDITRSPIALEVGANDVMYATNGRYIASYDGTTAQDKALDFPSSYETQDVRWMSDRLYIPTRYQKFTTPQSSIFIWDGTTDSWEAEIPVAGMVGAGYVKNGTYFQFYYDRQGTNKLAYLDGSTLVDLVAYDSGTKPPAFYQVVEWRNFLVWVPGPDSSDMYAYGSPGNGEPARLFHFADTGVSGTGKGGGLFNALNGVGLLVANNSQLYYLDTENLTNYQTASSWKSLMFDIAGDRQNGGQINSVRFNFEKLVSGAVLDWSLVNSQGKTIYSDKISYAKATASNPLHTLTTAYYPLNGKVTEDFRVELNYANGSTTAPVRVKNIKLYGEG